MTRKKKHAVDASHAGRAAAETRPSTTFTYRGRHVEIEKHVDAAALANSDASVLGTLRIDGRSVAYEQNSEGVLSHEFMFQRFGTPEELAEELIRQWGTSTPPEEPHMDHSHGSHSARSRGTPKRPKPRHDHHDHHEH